MPKIKTVNGTEDHKVVSQEEWLAARLELLKAEKQLTRHGDEVTQQRQALPWVKIDKDYRFATDEGEASLSDLFRGRSQLFIYHFMFGPEYTAGCPNCSAIADGFNSCVVHLANHDVMLWAVSLAPLSKLQAYKQRMGWIFPWASSNGSDFNYDFKVSFTEEQQRLETIEYNYKSSGLSSRSNEIAQSEVKVSEEGKKIAASTGTDWAAFSRQGPGMSAFALVDGLVFHTYSAYARGLDILWPTYQWLDRAPLGRNENGLWFRRHDEYDQYQGESKDCCS